MSSTTTICLNNVYYYFTYAQWTITDDMGYLLLFLQRFSLCVFKKIEP